ncbi:carbohydrate ABC transporter permease [Candidatus Clostridium radicumherbarum]|uniref:Carbohydrate ABC transporter permease n=1 Tax=Candidatus Clostridium radicumherbarum TaxID=3381662 RepID=A0ABW8TNY5_9CLOT
MINITKNTKVSKSKHLINKKYLSLLFFIAPALILYITFFVIPMISGVYYSFTDWNALNQTFKFLGLKNYIEAIKDDKYFMDSIIFTLKYAVVLVVSQNIFAIALAVLIDSKKRGNGFFRTIFFIPNMISMIISSFVWVFIFTKVLSEISTKTHIAFLNSSWLGEPKLAFIAILIVSLWVGVGYMMLIYLAALQGVPQELKEASIIDGASPFQTFFKITLPLIMHAITICTFLTLSTGFKAFDIIYALTGGGPVRSTTVMGLNIYNEAFNGNMRFAYASAKSIILFLIILVITLIQLGVLKRKEIEA